MKRVLFTVIIFCLLLLTAAGCAPANANRAEKRWQSQGISSYVIEVSHANSIWHYQRHVITVEDGKVTDFSASCATSSVENAMDKECAVEDFNPADYTVPGLFYLVRDLVASQPTNSLTIEYDPVYGYPARIIFDLPEVLDEDQSWVVEDFQLPEEADLDG